jgi:hypothetical protein
MHVLKSLSIVTGWKSMLLVLSALLLAAADAPPAPLPNEAGEGANKVTCKRFPPPVGTRLGERKICKTQAEWKAERQDTRELMDRIQRDPGKPTG